MRMRVSVGAALAALALCFGVAFQASATPRPKPELAVSGMAVTGGANVATSSFTPSSNGVWRITVGIESGATDSKVDVLINGTAYTLNSDAALTNGDLFAFSLGAYDGWSYNVSPQTTTTLTLQVDLDED